MSHPKLHKASDIWVLRPTDQDLAAGAHYASISLPWTFNRMMLNTGSKGQQGRALNIAKGIVGQEMLRRKLASLGVAAKNQIKSHRNDDLFDLRLSANGSDVRMDFKTVNFYTNYDPLGREPLSPDLIQKHRAYAGPDWRNFFPMLIPHTQIGQDKDIYCFAIASSIDFRNDIDTNRESHTIAAFPYGASLPFLTSNRLCQAREDAGKGFYIQCSHVTDGLPLSSKITLTIIGEWDGELKTQDVTIKPGQPTSDIGPFSCISSFMISRSELENLHGNLAIRVSRNLFDAPVYNSTRRNINTVPSEHLTLERADFCNLTLPNDYTLYVVGWLPKHEFLEQCRQYTGWVWPMDSVNRYENRPWNRITENDVKTLTRIDFQNCISSNPPLVNAGFLKTTGRGGGACCYFYPNIGRGGGVRETNLYVLPKDLYTMDSLSNN